MLGKSIKGEMVLNKDFYLMYRDIPVAMFNKDTEYYTIKHPSMLPFSIKEDTSYTAIQKFCSNRILMMNRKYCKEILTSCGIDDQSDLNICVVCHGLSFRDCYWIKGVNSDLTWDRVNLWNNEFSESISNTALTGESTSIIINDVVFTGELTNKGTRAKCYVRDNGKILLIKEETKREIFAELTVSIIADALGVPCARYSYQSIKGRDCSVCEIQTSVNVEMLDAREVLLHFNETAFKLDSNSYKYFSDNGKDEFVLMQLFDYITLNTDRNRDNFALMKQNGCIVGLYPLFDHDSCYKGKSINAHYFVTGVSFKETLDYLNKTYNLLKFETKINKVKEVIEEESFSSQLKLVLGEDYYNGLKERVNSILEDSDWKQLDIF